eukprot:EG_transcript_7084
MNALLPAIVTALVLALAVYLLRRHLPLSTPILTAPRPTTSAVPATGIAHRLDRAKPVTTRSAEQPPPVGPLSEPVQNVSCHQCPHAPSKPSNHPIFCNLTAVTESMQAKETLLRHARPGDPVRYYELRDRVYFSPWGGSTLTLLGALWAPGLPYLELLAFHRFHAMAIRLAMCMSTRPFATPTLLLPSGSAVACHAWWPRRQEVTRRLRSVAYRGGQPLITTVRYLCPVSLCDAQCLASLSAIPLSLTVPKSVAPVTNATDTVSFVVQKRRRPFTLVTACSQPLWGYGKMKNMYPALLDEWLAYLQAKGFGDVHVYELWGDAITADLRRWRAAGFVEYFPSWGSGKWKRDSRKFVYCTQSAAHDHCLFHNQLHARWAMIVHGPDLYPHGENITTLDVVLAPFDHRRVNTLRVSRQDCGGFKIPGQRSLLNSFNNCAVPESGSGTPFFNPLKVVATFVHGPLVSLPVSDAYDEIDVDPAHTVSVHFYDAFKTANSSQKGQLFEDNLRPKVLPQFSRRTRIADFYPTVLRVVNLMKNGSIAAAPLTPRPAGP